MARVKVDDSKFEVVKPKFRIDAMDEKTVFIVPDDYSDTNLHTLFTGFPEHKWRRIDGDGGWAVPVTKPNLDYLNRTWNKNEYTMSETARILLMYEELTARLIQLKLSVGGSTSLTILLQTSIIRRRVSHSCISV